MQITKQIKNPFFIYSTSHSIIWTQYYSSHICFAKNPEMNCICAPLIVLPQAFRLAATTLNVYIAPTTMYIAKRPCASLKPAQGLMILHYSYYCHSNSNPIFSIWNCWFSPGNTHVTAWLSDNAVKYALAAPPVTAPDPKISPRHPNADVYSNVLVSQRNLLSAA